ncbi:MAG: Rrf2 family transcriptional regulator [Candidatus Margulisiibacteriota bacterium]|jgi:Rrf2 family protein
MKITFKGDYALKAVLDLSAHFGTAQRIEEIAKRQDIPVKFLEQILLSLKKGGFVRSLRGRSGGYELARSPEKITLGQVIRYVEGPIEPISCVLKKGRTRCDFADRCALYDVFDEIGVYLAKKVDSLTFAELRDRQKKKEIQGKKYLDYSI